MCLPTPWQVVDYLKHVPTFAKFSDQKIEDLADKLSLRTVQAGDTVIKKGQPGTTFFLIKSGQVGFSLQDDGTIQSTRDPGEFFGEIALVEGGPCTATAIAQTVGANEMELCDLVRVRACHLCS